MRPSLGKKRPIWAICTKSGQTCSRIGGKQWFHLSSLLVLLQPKRDYYQGAVHTLHALKCAEYALRGSLGEALQIPYLTGASCNC